MVQCEKFNELKLFQERNKVVPSVKIGKTVFSNFMSTFKTEEFFLTRIKLQSCTYVGDVLGPIHFSRQIRNFLWNISTKMVIIFVWKNLSAWETIYS